MKDGGASEVDERDEASETANDDDARAPEVVADPEPETDAESEADTAEPALPIGPQSKPPTEVARALPASPRRSRLRAAILALIVIALGASAFAFWRSQRSVPLPPAPAKADLLDAIPTAPMLLATIDLDALRASRLGALLQAQEGPSVLGRVRETCGFEPVDSLRAIALVIPASTDDADFGLVAVGDLNQAAIVDCAQKVIASRGGKPISTTLGSFRTVRDTAASSGEIAVRNGGPLLVGAGNYLRTMVDTADGSLATVRTDRAHVALRLALVEGTQAKVTIVLTAHQRATIADEVGRSGGRAPSALTAVLAAALGAKVTPETVQLHAVVLVENETSAKDLLVAFDALRKERADNPLLRLLGLGQQLDRVRIRAETTQIHLELEMTITEVEMLADKLLALRGDEASEAPEPAALTPSGSAEVGAQASAHPRASASPRAAPVPSASASHPHGP